MVVQRDVPRRDFIIDSVTSLAAAAFSSGIVFGRETDFERGNGQIVGSIMAGDIHPGGATIWSKGQSTSRFFVEYSHFPDFKNANVVEGRRASQENDFTGRAVLSDLSPGQDIFLSGSFSR